MISLTLVIDEIILAWARNVLLDIWINRFCLSMHMHLGSFRQTRWNRILAGSWNFIESLDSHTSASFSSNLPTSRLQLRPVNTWIILTWGSLPTLRLFKLEVSSCFSANFESWLVFLHISLLRRVVAWSRHLVELSDLRGIVLESTHGVRWLVFASQSFG